MLNKSRLQNTVDASALAAAKVLDSTGSEANADTAARNVFDLNAASQPELNRVMSGADLTIQFSSTLNPWAPGTTPANYVRVVADDFTMWTSFTSLVGITETRMAASAVAGPSAPVGMTEGNEACDLTPMMVCADMSPGAPGDFGYTGDNVSLLKMGSNATGPIGPGNFQLFELGGAGANIVRQNLAGSYDQCIDPSGTVTTKPGNNTGPTAQGLNTRFGEYQGGGMNATDFRPTRSRPSPVPSSTRPATRHTSSCEATAIPRSRTSTRSTTPTRTMRKTSSPGLSTSPRASPSAASSRCLWWTARARSTDTERSRSSGSGAST